MTRYLLAGAVVLSLGLWGWVQMQRADALAVKLEQREAQLVEQARVSEIQRQSIRRLQALAENAAKLDREFQEKDGADDALPDYLRSGAGRLWP